MLCVQLVIICCLQHKEIGALFGVCRELRATVRQSALAQTLNLTQQQTPVLMVALALPLTPCMT